MSNETDTGVTSSMRTVLYGDAHRLNRTSESISWENHISASTFASHSVTRFRLRTKVIEPVGYKHNTTTIVNEKCCVYYESMWGE